jgi:hypothetical protein
MSKETHLSELERRHRLLEDTLKAAKTSPSTDDVELAKLKRRKLQIKDEIERLKTMSAAGQRMH